MKTYASPVWPLNFLCRLVNFSASNSILSGYVDYSSIDPSLLDIFDPPPPDISYFLRIEWLRWGIRKIIDKCFPLKKFESPFYFVLHRNNSDRITTVANVVSFSVVAGIMNHIYRKQIAQLPPYNQVLREGLLLKRLSVLAAGSSEVEEENEKEIFKNPEDTVDPDHIRKHSVKSHAGDEENEDEGVDEAAASANRKDSVDTGSQGARKSSGNNTVQHLKKVGKVLRRKPVVHTKYKPKIAHPGKTNRAKTKFGDSRSTNKRNTDGHQAQSEWEF